MKKHVADSRPFLVEALPTFPMKWDPSHYPSVIRMVLFLVVPRGLGSQNPNSGTQEAVTCPAKPNIM